MVVVVFNEDLIAHAHWEGHPESPMRLKSLMKMLEREGLINDHITAVPVTESQLLCVHSQVMIDKVKGGKGIPLDPDTALHEETFDLACLSAGMAVEAVRHALKGEVSIALTRPPGHHAGPDYSCGFCYFNNVAVAAESAGVRTAIVDIDAHHGNGTQDIFYRRKDILYVSVHEEGIFPGTGRLEEVGEGDGEGYNVNIPLPHGAGNDSFKESMERIILPVLRQYRPELLLVSLGIDAHYADRYSTLNLNTDMYLHLCKMLIEVAPGGCIAFILEGGYHLRATAEVVHGIIAHVKGTSSVAEYAEESGENPRAMEYVQRAVDVHSRHWDL